MGLDLDWFQLLLTGPRNSKDLQHLLVLNFVCKYHKIRCIYLNTWLRMLDLHLWHLTDYLTVFHQESTEYFLLLEDNHLVLLSIHLFLKKVGLINIAFQLNLLHLWEAMHIQLDTNHVHAIQCL